MLFWLKKILTIPFLPLDFALLAGCLALIFALRRKTWRSQLLFSLGFIVLAGASNEAISNVLLAPIESRYPAIPEIRSQAEVPAALAPCRAVVVLGGGHADSPTLSRVNQLSTSTLSRLTEAVRLLRWLPEAKLVTSGHHTAEISHAQVVAEAAISLGVDPNRIERMDDPRDTDDEIAEVKRRYKDAPVAIVTSAWHMPRAMALCEHYGVHAVPCPADFMYRPEAGGNRHWATWNIESLERSTKAVHEQLGLLWLRIRG